MVHLHTSSSTIRQQHLGLTEQPQEQPLQQYADGVTGCLWHPCGDKGMRNDTSRCQQAPSSFAALINAPAVLIGAYSLPLAASAAEPVGIVPQLEPLCSQGHNMMSLAHYKPANLGTCHVPHHRPASSPPEDTPGRACCEPAAARHTVSRHHGVMRWCKAAGMCMGRLAAAAAVVAPLHLL